MPWNECSVMDERLQFVARRLAGEPMAEPRALACALDKTDFRFSVWISADRDRGHPSIDDVLLHSEMGRFGTAPEISFDEAAATLKKLYRPDLPQLVFEKVLTA
jgi:hypothetical protein